jgi:hypothetical protein
MRTSFSPCWPLVRGPGCDRWTQEMLLYFELLNVGCQTPKWPFFSKKDKQLVVEEGNKEAYHVLYQICMFSSSGWSVTSRLVAGS